MLGLLGHMAAGGATGYANVKNAQTEALNRVESAMFTAEVADMFQQRRDERMGKLEEAKYQRDVARDDIKYERDRAAKKEDFGMASEHDLRKLEVSHGHRKDLENARQAAAMERTRISQAGANARLEKRLSTGLLNTSANNSGSGFSQKEISKANESDRKRIFDLQKELTDPMNAHNAGRSDLLKQEIKRLRDGVARRTYGDAQPNLNALFDDQPQSRQQPQFTPKELGAPIRDDRAGQVQAGQVRRSPRTLSELENTLRSLPANDGSRAELQGVFDSARPLIEQLRMIDAELRSLPFNAGEDRRALLNAKRNELEQEIQGRLARG